MERGTGVQERVRGQISPAQCREIARAAVNVWKAKVGRGPVDAKAFASDDAVALVMRGVLTTPEKSLVAAGRLERVRSMRRQVFEVNREELIETVERACGRKVVAALYDAAPEHDTSAITFVLEASSAG